MNDIMGENGLVSLCLVFGIVSRFFVLSTDLPIQKTKIKALKTAQTGINSIVAERKIFKALTTNIPHAAGRANELREEAFDYSEDKK